MRVGAVAGAVISVLVALVGLTVVARASDAQTAAFGWLLVVVGALFVVANLLLHRRSR